MVSCYPSERRTVLPLKKRFPALYLECRCARDVPQAVTKMIVALHSEVLEHDLVHVGFISAYEKLLLGMGLIAEGLFGLTEGVLRFEVTKEHGITMRFRPHQSTTHVYTMVEVGWLYANRVGWHTTVEEQIIESLARGSGAYQEIAMAAGVA